MDFVLRSKHVLSQINVKRSTSFNYLKPAQIKCLKSLQECDTLGILPTGYGKSLIFEALPYFNSTTVLIIPPLNSIIEEQIARYGDDAIHITEDLVKSVSNDVSDVRSIGVDKLRNCEAKYIIGHPEQFLAKPVFQLMKNDTWQEKVSHIVIDEAHCIVQWGPGFREKFLELGKLRSVFPEAKVLALTATATIKMQKDIIKCLGMKNVRTVISSIDRQNIKFSVVRRPAGCGSLSTVEESYDFVFRPLVEELSKHQDTFSKTIVYAKLKWCGYGYEETVKRNSAENSDEIEQLVAQYHSPCTPQMRHNVMTSMSDPNGAIKLLFATEAYSMGTDAPDVRRIIHAGAPTSLETYIQEVGRAGRDGLQAEAVLYFNKSDISNNVAGMTDEMRNYCELGTCRRKYLCEHFGFYLETTSNHACCDVCEKECKCDDCVVSQELQNDMEDDLNVNTNESDTSEQYNTSVANAVYATILDYFEEENSSLQIPNATLSTGLTELLAKNVSKDYLCYKNVDIIQQKHPWISNQVAENISLIIHHIELSVDSE